MSFLPVLIAFGSLPLRVSRDTFHFAIHLFHFAALTIGLLLNPTFWKVVITIFVLWLLGAFIVENHSTIISELDNTYVCFLRSPIATLLGYLEPVAIVFDKLACFWNLITTFIRTLIFQGLLLLIDCVDTDGHTLLENILLRFTTTLQLLINTAVTWLTGDPFTQPIDTFPVWDNLLNNLEFLLPVTTCLCEDLRPIVQGFTPILESTNLRCMLTNIVNAYVTIIQFIANIIQTFQFLQRPDFSPIFNELCTALTCTAAFIDEIVLFVFQFFTNLTEIRIACLLRVVGCIYLKIYNLLLDVLVHIDIIVVDLFTNPLNPNSYLWRGAAAGGLDIEGLLDLLDNQVTGFAGCVKFFFLFYNIHIANALSLFIRFWVQVLRSIYHVIQDPRFLFSGGAFLNLILLVDEFTNEVGLVLADMFSFLDGKPNPCGGGTHAGCGFRIGILAGRLLDVLLIPLQFADRAALLIGNIIGFTSPGYSFIDALLDPEQCHPSLLTVCESVHYVDPIATTTTGIIGLPHSHVGIEPEFDKLVNSFGDDVVGIALDLILIIYNVARAALISAIQVFDVCIPCFGLHNILAIPLSIGEAIFRPTQLMARFVGRTVRLLLSWILFWYSLFFFPSSSSGLLTGMAKLFIFWVFDSLDFILQVLYLFLDFTIFLGFFLLTEIRFTVCLSDFGCCAYRLAISSCDTILAPSGCAPLASCPPKKRSILEEPNYDVVPNDNSYFQRSRRAETKFNMREFNNMLLVITPRRSSCREIFEAYADHNESSNPMTEIERHQYMQCVAKYKAGMELNEQYPFMPSNYYLQRDDSIGGKKEIMHQMTNSILASGAWFLENGLSDFRVTMPPADSEQSQLQSLSSSPSPPPPPLPSSTQSFQETLSYFGVTHPVMQSYAGGFINRIEGVRQVYWDTLANSTSENLNISLEDTAMSGLGTVKLGMKVVKELRTVVVRLNIFEALNFTFNAFANYFSKNISLMTDDVNVASLASANDTMSLTLKELVTPGKPSLFRNNPLLPFTWDFARDPRSVASNSLLGGKPFWSNQWNVSATRLQRFMAKIRYQSNMLFFGMDQKLLGVIPNFQCELLDRAFNILINRTSRCATIINAPSPARKRDMLAPETNYYMRRADLDNVVVHNYTKTFSLTTTVFHTFDLILDQLEKVFHNTSLGNATFISTGVKDFFANHTHGIASYFELLVVCHQPENLDCSRGIGLLKGYGIAILIFLVIIPIAAYFLFFVDPIWKFLSTIGGILFFLIIANGIAFFYSPICFPGVPECLGRQIVDLLRPLNRTCLDFIPAYAVMFPADGSCLPCGQRRQIIRCDKDRGFFDGLDNFAFLLEWIVPSVSNFTRTNLDVVPNLIDNVTNTVNTTSITDAIRNPFFHFNYGAAPIPPVDIFCFTTTSLSLSPLLFAFWPGIPIFISASSVALALIVVVVSTVFYVLYLPIPVILFIQSLSQKKEIEDNFGLLLAMQMRSSRAAAAEASAATEQTTPEGEGDVITE